MMNNIRRRLFFRIAKQISLYLQNGVRSNYKCGTFGIRNGFRNRKRNYNRSRKQRNTEGHDRNPGFRRNAAL